AQWLVQALGTRRAAALALLVFLALVVSTWKQLVQSLYIGMSGRESLVKAAVFAALGFLTVMLPVGHWIVTDDAARGAVWRAFPAILGGFVCLKVVAASWIALLRHDSRTMLRAVIAWNICVLSLYGVLAWIFPTLVIRHYVLALIAILAVPL